MTDKQFALMKALLIELGHAHPQYGLRASGRAITGAPHSATRWEEFRSYFTSTQASRIIGRLIEEKQSRRLR